MSTSTSRDWGEPERPLVDIVESNGRTDEFVTRYTYYVTRVTYRQRDV